MSETTFRGLLDDAARGLIKAGHRVIIADDSEKATMTIDDMNGGTDNTTTLNLHVYASADQIEHILAAAEACGALRRRA